VINGFYVDSLIVFSLLSIAFKLLDIISSRKISGHVYDGLAVIFLTLSFCNYMGWIS